MPSASPSAQGDRVGEGTGATGPTPVPGQAGGFSDALDVLAGAGALVRPVDAFDARSPHCNKIAGALRLAEDGVEGLAVLCDTDIAVVEDPRGLVLPGGGVAAKLVDA